MKYYIEYPIPLDCFLQCEYCFHSRYFKKQNGEDIKDKYIKDLTGENKPVFTIEEYLLWRDTHLKDADEIIMHLMGGEPSDNRNVDVVYDILNKTNKEKIEIQSNGLGNEEFFNKLKDYKDKLHRVIFTFHRTVIKDNQKLIDKFIKNVLLVKSFGITVIVKELLIVSQRDEILKNKKFWIAKDVQFKIQDFKGTQSGVSYEEYQQYSPIDFLLVDNEYKHDIDSCCCKRGYKNIIIRGYDFGSGDVIACWFCPTSIIGNIKQNTFHPDYKIIKKNGKLDVTGVEKIEKGKLLDPEHYYENDIWMPEKPKGD